MSLWAIKMSTVKSVSLPPNFQLMDDFAVLRIDSAQIRHSGKWRITATNPIGSDKAVLEFVVNSRPNPPAGVPQIVDSGANSVKLCWEAAPKSSSSKEDLKYQVEYNREKWDIWLKGRVTGDLEATVTDLIPGSYYRFRVRTVTETGTSEPGAISEQVFLGAPMEDEVFGLPGMANNAAEETFQLSLTLFCPFDDRQRCPCPASIADLIPSQLSRIFFLLWP